VYGSSPLAAVVAWDGGSNFSHYRAVLQPEIDKFRLRYNEFIAYADDAFGRFIGKADALPNAAETVVMVSADHGENFAHGFWGHETSEMWQPTIHVPLAVRLPGKAAAGHRISGLAGHIDLMPTILDLAGAPVPSWCEGGSLLPIWRGGGGQQQRRRFAEMIDSPLRRPITSGGIAVLEGDDKFVLNIASGAGRLYDLATDPFEEHDLSRARPERAQVLRNAALARVERDPTAA
jgi:arylsulfatase A-like enzyme